MILAVAKQISLTSPKFIRNEQSKKKKKYSGALRADAVRMKMSYVIQPGRVTLGCHSTGEMERSSLLSEALVPCHLSPGTVLLRPKTAEKV